MPPKRRGGAAKGGAAAKKAKKGAAAAANDDPAPSTIKDAVAALKAADAGKKKSGGKVDQYVSLPASSSAVYEDYDCMLNQTNIGHNNNKYYVIQVVACYNNYYAFNRWGRVGEPGQTKLSGPFGDSAKAISEFKKKFKDKTKNDWDNRASFKPAAGKYTLIEMDDDDEDDAATAEKCAKLDAIDGVKKTVLPCTLDKPTQDLVKLIFDQDMFKEAMASFDIDVKKMPLGKLSKSQIAKGFECLEEIEEGMKKKNHNTLQALTSRFYTLIPHDFGRKRPPIIGDEETLRKKKDMLLVLGDIELATSMQKAQSESYTGEEKSVPHPYDENYSLLKCDLDVVEKKSNEFKLIENYTKATDGGRNLKIKEVWKVNRDGEAGRFAAHDKTGNRKLLWHGTNVAVVAAILKSGLRIMPHSGGRVGRGIYFASENSKSAGYVGCAGKTGIMFLNEVVLGKEHLIKQDDWRLTAAPKGHDCIIAKGWTEPDPKQDKTLEIEGHTVVVPQGKPINQPSFRDSSFSQSEYLVYKESQARIRYLLKMEF